MKQIDDFDLYNRRYSFIELKGEFFSPRKFELKTKLKLYEISEPNEIYTEKTINKRLRGKTCNSGSAILQPPINVQFERNWLLKKIIEFKKELKRYRIEEITFWEIAYFIPNSQKNFEISSKQLKQMAELKINYCLSIYEIEKNEKKILPKRYWEQKNRTL